MVRKILLERNQVQLSENSGNVAKTGELTMEMIKIKNMKLTWD